MSKFDRLIHALMQTEVVGRDDEAGSTLSYAIHLCWLDSIVTLTTQYAGCVDIDNNAYQVSCARRKRKNSTPSRKRRFSMSQLPSISRTISQILLGRK